jgi:DNA mismatch repair protein MSH5
MLCWPPTPGFGDLKTRIRDLEVRFIAGLQAKVASFNPQLLALSARVYDLDCHIALAKAARDLGLVRPRLTDEARVHITGGRHLLHQLHDSGERQFIPNDTTLGEAGRNGGDIHLITGPNGVSPL